MPDQCSHTGFPHGGCTANFRHVCQPFCGGGRGVLNQVQGDRDVVIAFASRSIRLSQRRYCTTRQEMLAAVVMCTHFRSYIRGAQFTLCTDHSSLRWLQKFWNSDGMLAPPAMSSQLVVPDREHQDLIRRFACHLGVSRTAYRLLDRIYWPGLHQECPLISGLRCSLFGPEVSLPTAGSHGTCRGGPPMGLGGDGSSGHVSYDPKAQLVRPGHGGLFLSMERGLLLLMHFFSKLFAGSECRLSFLVHIVGWTGLACDPEKILAVRNWHAPSSVKGVHQFVGFIGYYRQFRTLRVYRSRWWP